MFGERLKLIRSEHKLTQQELAPIMRVSASTVGMYEQGRRDPDTNTVAFLAQYFKVSTDWLLGLTDVRAQQGQDRPYLDTTGLPLEDVIKVEEYMDLLRKKYVQVGDKPKDQEKKVRKNSQPIE